MDAVRAEDRRAVTMPHHEQHVALRATKIKKTKMLQKENSKTGILIHEQD